MVEAKKVLRVATIIAAGLLFLLSIIRFIKVSTLSFSQVVLSVYMM